MGGMTKKCMLLLRYINTLTVIISNNSKDQIVLIENRTLNTLKTTLILVPVEDQCCPRERKKCENSQVRDNPWCCVPGIVDRYQGMLF